MLNKKARKLVRRQTCTSAGTTARPRRAPRLTFAVMIKV